MNEIENALAWVELFLCVFVFLLAMFAALTGHEISGVFALGCFLAGIRFGQLPARWKQDTDKQTI